VKAVRGKSKKNDQKTKNDSAQSNNTGGWGHDEMPVEIKQDSLLY